ncbi:MAG TPA: sulfotransferase [Actinomycetota bacterium]|nr:sulfotransferase [Actinomycetota bacterium]
MLPSFLILGGQRCGTTSLYRYLSEHPSVTPPLLKEIQFFTLNYFRGVDWYRGHFPPAGDTASTFDASPYYLFHPLAAERAGAVLPQARCIALVRNPVERAFSHYQHNVGLGVEDLSFEHALDAEGERLAGEEERICADQGYASAAHRRFSYAARGEYEPQLRRWLDHFQGRLEVVVSEEFFADTGEVFDHILKFLGLPEFRLDSYEAYTRRRTSGAPAMDERTRQRLRERFAEPNRRLEALLGRTLPWS